MKSLVHLSPDQQKELNLVVELIRCAEKSVEKIILFGSYARGDWVRDRYSERGTTYEYHSDYDILVAVKGKKQEQNLGLWHGLEEQIHNHSEIKTPVSLVVDRIDFVNQRIAEGNYFYVDIQKEGISLYDSGRFTFVQPRLLSLSEQKSLAARDFALWFGRATECLAHYEGDVAKKSYHWAAFFLHQATESLFVSLLLVMTGYRPKTHDLAKLESRVIVFDSRLKEIFPKKNDTARKLFELLKRAYVDARYKAEYKITKGQLTTLATRVRKLQAVVEGVCKARIKELKEGKVDKEY